MTPFTFVLLLALSSWVALQTTPKPSGAARELEFAWPEGITARVEVEFERSRERGDGTAPAKTILVRGRYRMRVMPHPEGKLVRYDQYEHLEPSLGGGSETLGDFVSSWMPSVLVGANGTFRGIEDIAPLKKTLDDVVASLIATSGQVPAGLNEMLSMLTSEAYLTRAAAQEWQALVGSWIGVPAVANTFQLTMEEPSLLWPDAKVPMNIKVGVSAPRTCMRTGQTFNCVLLEVTSVPDPAAMQALMRRLLEGQKDLQTMTYDRYDVTTVVRVSLETATMLPHHFTSVKTINVAATAPGGERVKARQLDHKTLKYTYILPETK